MSFCGSGGACCRRKFRDAPECPDIGCWGRHHCCALKPTGAIENIGMSNEHKYYDKVENQYPNIISEI